MSQFDRENVAYLSAPPCVLLADRSEGQVGRLRRYVRMLRDIAFSVAQRALRVCDLLPDVESIPTVIHMGNMPIRLRRISDNSPQPNCGVSSGGSL